MKKSSLHTIAWVMLIALIASVSTTWGAGLKLYPNPSVGFSLMGRWTPTYIKSDPAGYWCGWYGCWLVGDAQFANQFELTGGVSFRF